MKHKALIIAISALSSSLFAADSQQLQREIQRLQKQTQQLQLQLNHLQKQLIKQPVVKLEVKKEAKSPAKVQTKKQPAVLSPTPSAKPVTNEKNKYFHTSPLVVHAVDSNPESIGFYPTALIADNKVISYIAGTPVVTSPYLGDRPAFDGSDYIVNISSINRDIRLMQQRRRLYRAYEGLGYPTPDIPIIAISGKAEPVGMINRPYVGRNVGDINLGSSELDVAAALNNKVEAFMSIAYDETRPPIGPRVSNSAFSLNMGFVNVGNLDQSPFYFTAGQMYVPFGRYSSSMISSPLPLSLARTKSRPFIVGYKSQEDFGPYAAVYGFKSETNLGHSGIGGVNLGYTIKSGELSGDIGAGYISSLTDSSGMQNTGSTPFTTFGGFASATNGSELIHKVPGIDVHGNLSFDRYSLTAEWVGASRSFMREDLSFNGRGAKPQAAQLEAGVTFMAFDKPASAALGYQWSKDTLALNLPQRRISGVFNISIWKDTVESLEYRHDVDFKPSQYANGIPAPGLLNLDTIGTGRSANALIAQIGVYF
ncbi:LbtU family siderophore porin [Legionella fairfieldensis]|uniref:LbtU family siderophore porin n=1 Tax=Legionella fairfieldensis TaxID=45064 RepID=UPI0004909618|nr:LbtU family siderophore porin [Legionella fairfieldensis]